MHWLSRKSVVTSLLVAGFAAGAAASSSSAADCSPTPATAAEAWLKTYWTGDLIGAWKLLHPDEKAATVQELWQEQSKSALIDTFALRRKVEIAEIEFPFDKEADATEATARLSIKTPLAVAEYDNLRKRAESASSFAEQSAYGPALARLRAAILSGTAQMEPTVIERSHLSLRRFENSWCVDLGLARDLKQSQAASVRMRELRQRAANALLQIAIVNARRGKGYFNYGQATGVFGTLVNNSNETVVEIAIVIQFLDKGGRTIHEKEWTIADDTYDREGPVKPNFRRQFAFRADDVPAEWDGAVRAKVRSVKVCAKKRHEYDRPDCGQAKQE